MNMDETSLPLSFGDQKGAVLSRVHSQKAKIVAAKNKQRGCLTLVATISDNSTLQPHVPQVIVGGEKSLRVRDLQQCEQNLPSNVYLVRRKNGWLDAPLFCQILKWLRSSMSEVDPTIEILLLVDASPVHSHPLCLRMALRQRIRLCFVPANCTWLIQPCDTHLFRKLKAQLANAVLEYKVRQEVVEVPMTEYVSMICGVIRSVIQGTRWSDSFDHNGYGRGQEHVSQRVLQNVLPSIRDAVADVVPSADAIATLFPRNKSIAIQLLIDAVTKSMEQAATHSAGAAVQRRPCAGMRTPRVQQAHAGERRPHADVADTEHASGEHAVLPWSRRLRPRSSSQIYGTADSQADSDSACAQRREAPAATSRAPAPCQSSTRLAVSPAQAMPAARLRRRPGSAAPMAMARPRTRPHVPASSLS